MTAIVWAALVMVTVLLVVLTWQVLTHNPNVCRVCVDRAAKSRYRRGGEW